MVNLLLCPFCGSEPNPDSPQAPGPYVIYCDGCDMFGPPSESYRIAVEKWNTRAAMAKDPQL